MKVIIAWDGDHIGREVGRASLADDVEGLRRISQAIDQGNKIWESWVTMNGGSLVSYGGDEGRAEIPAEKLSELPRIRDQYAQAVQSTVSVGVGTKLSEADRALMVAKLRGGDRIVLYTQDLEPEIEQAMKTHEGRSEVDKLSEEYLGKANAPRPPAIVEGRAAGFTGATPPTPPTINEPQAEASEHSQGEAIRAMVDEQAPAPETTHAAEDFEEMFHDYAQKQDKKDQGQPAGGDLQEQLKAQVVQVLQAVKAQAPVLEQVKQSAPDTYAAVMALVQAVIAMAKRLNGDSVRQSAEEKRGLKGQAQSRAVVEDSAPSEESEVSSGIDPSAKEDSAKKAEALQDDLKKTQKEEESQPSQGKSERHDCDEFGHIWGDDDDGGEYCLLCGKSSEEMEKASLQPGAKTVESSRHYVILPVGSQIDPGPHARRRTAGRIKVEHPETGRQSWVQVRAGQVLSRDGHPISARNPDGR